MSEKKEKSVYVLTQTYKDNDPDTLGAYDSLTALCQGFARILALDRLPCSKRKLLKNDAEFRKAIDDLVNDVARLIPALLRCDWAEEDECRDGRTVYGWEEIPVGSVMGVEDDVLKQEAT